MKRLFSNIQPGGYKLDMEMGVNGSDILRMCAPVVDDDTANDSAGDVNSNAKAKLDKLLLSSLLLLITVSDLAVFSNI